MSGDPGGRVRDGAGRAAGGAPLRTHALRIVTGEHDLPADRLNDHVNNARYFAFINDTFQGWYRAMGIRGGIPDRGGVMARLEYDFLREVKPPSVVECRIAVTRAGRSSLEHAVELYDLGPGGHGEPLLAGRGRAIHVWTDRVTRRSIPWPPEVLARCWDGGAPEAPAP